MTAAGDEVQMAYEAELKSHPNSILIATPPGFLSCKQIFFVRWEPDSDEDILQQSLADMISIAVQNTIAHRFTSIAFPAIGCEQHGYSTRVVVKTMVLEVKKRLINQNLSWTVKFVMQSDQQDIYDEFCKQVVTADDGKVKLFFLLFLFNALSLKFICSLFFISDDRFRQRSLSFLGRSKPLITLQSSHAKRRKTL